jgi:uncharacterized protein (TIGR02145 family)
MRHKIVIISILILFCHKLSFLQAQTVQDYNGNTYHTVTIGSQTWTIENLEVSNFRNGDPIPEAKTIKKWNAAGNEEKPAWCYYNFDPANGTKYGKLYNWYAVNDTRSLAPEGWHIPSDAEWTVLIDFLGGEKVAGAKMKSMSEWNDLRSKKDNDTISSGFAALPGGACNHSGSFYGIGDVGAWWSSSWSRTDIAWARNLFYATDDVSRDGNYKRVGLSVRYLKDN